MYVAQIDEVPSLNSVQLFFCGASVFEEIIHHLMILKIMTLIAAREKKREFDVNLLKQIVGVAFLSSRDTHNYYIGKSWH